MSRFEENVRAILLMSVSQIFLVSNDTLAKLATATLPIGEVIFIRSVIATLIVASVVVATGQYRHLSALRGMHLWARTAGDIGATTFYLLALAHLPLPTVVTVFQATPFVMTAAAAIFLGEAVGWRRRTAIAVGFAGVLVVVRPGVDTFNFGLFFILGSIASVTVRDLTTRQLPPAMRSLLVTGVSAVALMLAGAVIGLFESWTMPSVRVVIELGGGAALLIVGSQCLILSLRTGDLSVAAPFRYTVIVWGTILGFLVWRDVPDLFTILGTVVIIASGIYMFQRERRLARIPSLDEL